ncbi:DUF397 domain-containing protein [Streptomyces xinghaiensis]|uniref:DUF397 domain-containing protein n=1 Tax=Streptomyces xinghaiensis TaxID=1038928 RepID=UPI003414A150
MSTPLNWFTSSHSSEEGGNCVEVAYRRSESAHHRDDSASRSATLPTSVHVRDSKYRSGPTLTIAPAVWAAFTASLS